MPYPTREAAFREIIRKARGGAIGAAIGATVMFLIAYTLGDNPDYALCLAIGILGGGAGGAIMAGTDFGTIGVSVVIGAGLGNCMAVTVLVQSGFSEWVPPVAIISMSICFSFAAGAAIELYRSK